MLANENFRRVARSTEVTFYYLFLLNKYEHSTVFKILICVYILLKKEYKTAQKSPSLYLFQLEGRKTM